VVFQFPKQKIIYGPRQIVGRINQDQTISPQITLWNQQGSQVIWGTLLVIPIEESLLYVRPLYLRSPEGRIPELKRVIVAYQNRIVMDETLPRALAQIFGPEVGRALAPDGAGAAGAAGTTTVSTAAGSAAGAIAGVAPAGPAGSAELTLAALATEASLKFDLAGAALRNGDLARYAEEIARARDVIRRMMAIRR
jgi:uncharacterized membrane protein (UPF0182 family)